MEGNVVSLLFYGCFLSARTMTKPTTMMAMRMAMDIGMKYRSAIEGACVACGAGVAAA
jgi:hypothetical protein